MTTSRTESIMLPFMTDGCLADASGRKETRRFQFGLPPFRLHIRIDHDAGTNSQLGSVRGHHERANSHVEVEGGAIGVNPSHRAAVNSPPADLEIFDDLHHPRLG